MDAKPFWQSKTLVSLAILVTVKLGGFVGLHLDPANATLITDVTLMLGVVGDAVTALFHTISTKRPV